MSWDIYKSSIHQKWKKYWIDTHPPEIGEYSWNYLFTGGKEIRPRLFCELWQYLSPDLPVSPELAFAIECIHVSSIVLDDTPWMDNANERRGKQTLHTVFSPKKAVLISYDLLDIAIDIWKNNKPNHIDSVKWMNLLKTKLQRLMVGQWYDLEKTGTLVELASLKTGVLFELVTETVALCVNLDTEFWKLWGNNLGILFQWMDDYLDMEEDKQQNNRNAFNETYDSTLANYIHLWQSIEKGISSDWFNKDLGKFMKSYFVDTLKLVTYPESRKISSLTNIEYPTNIIIPEIQTSRIPTDAMHYFNFVSGKQMIQHIWRNIDKMTSNNIKHDYWTKDESLWEVPTI